MKNLKSIQKIHDAIQPYTFGGEFQFSYDYDANKAYNKYVSNGTHKPENFQELVFHILNGFIPEYGKEVIEAYKKLCFFEDERNVYFQFPSYKEVLYYINGKEK